MKKFIKITTRNEDGSIVRSWIDQEQIAQLSQHTQQQGDNEGTCRFVDGSILELITFNETLDSLN
jgi:hypothetical protein